MKEAHYAGITGCGSAQAPVAERLIALPPATWGGAPVPSTAFTPHSPTRHRLDPVPAIIFSVGFLISVIVIWWY
jgi:hypothetical protein